MAVFALMAVYAAIALVWRIKLCEILAMACGAGRRRVHRGHPRHRFDLGQADVGHVVGLGSAPDHGLILLFLYLGVIGLYHAIDDRRQADRAQPACWPWSASCCCR